jgi:hypothetical protein
MLTPDNALSAIPDGLKNALLQEYSTIISNFMERRWTPAELSGGRFCEIVYTILEGHLTGKYPSKPTKPKNFVDACKKLESSTITPRSFQILIPRLLPALYEIRNNRNVGHVGGDVDPDFMDCSAVVSFASWILAELVRVFHGVTTEEAQKAVDLLSERRIPLVWKSQDMRRVLDPKIPLRSQILLLAASVAGRVPVAQLISWTDSQSKTKYFMKLLRQMHSARLLEFYVGAGEIELLPPGTAEIQSLMSKYL